MALKPASWEVNAATSSIWFSGWTYISLKFWLDKGPMFSFVDFENKGTKLSPVLHENAHNNINVFQCLLFFVYEMFRLYSTLVQKYAASGWHQQINVRSNLTWNGGTCGWKQEDFSFL